jgi:hypothetical protein
LCQLLSGDSHLQVVDPFATTGGQIKFLGAIDMTEINHEIDEVMQDGVEASSCGIKNTAFRMARVTRSAYRVLAPIPPIGVQKKRPAFDRPLQSVVWGARPGKGRLSSG